MADLTPHFEDVQSHYDLSDDFYRLFLDRTQTYSCAYFERDDMPLEEAQIAKIDLSLGKLGLEPGMTLLDIGCGWGATLLRAVEKYDVNVIGLTLSENQCAHVEKAFAALDSARSKRVLLKGWEQFDEPVDRIVSIGAFEHFGQDRYDDFFAMAYRSLPEDGVMLLHTITRLTLTELKEQDIPLTMDAARFASFIAKEIFPGGHLPTIEAVQTQAASAGLDGHSDPITADALRAHARHLGTRAAGAPGRGDRRPIRRGLRPILEVPDRLRRHVPEPLHRHQPVHAGQVAV